MDDILTVNEVKYISVNKIKKYLFNCMDEWNQLGVRKYEQPNIQVYNHILAELDDLSISLEGHND